MSLRPIHLAAKRNNISMLSELILSGEDIESEYVNRWRPLHVAAANGHEESTKFLIESGANIESKTTDNGWTPLHMAAVYGREYVVEILVNSGADIDAQDFNLRTPAMLAKRYEYKKIVGFLEFISTSRKESEELLKTVKATEESNRRTARRSL